MSISTNRPISLLVAILAWIRRRLFCQNIAKPGRSALDHRRVQFSDSIPSTTGQDDSEKGVICAMTAPSRHESPESQDGSSPVDVPYEVSSSGHLVPYSPAPSRRYTQEHISWISSSQTSLHEQPSPIDHELPHSTFHSTLQRTGSRSSIRAYQHNHGQNPDTSLHVRVSCPPNPLRPIVAYVPSLPQTFSGSPVCRTPSAGRAHLLNGGATFEVPQSKTPVSIRSISQNSESHRSSRSHNSAVSTGRASYRRHHGPPARARSPTPNITQDRSIQGTGHSTALAPPGRLVAMPNVDDPSQPGEPIVHYDRPRFAPMSTLGVSRYNKHRRPNVIRRPTETDHMIDAMLHEYPETQDPVPQRWSAHRHPEGALYFMHDESRTFTDVNICKEDVLKDVEGFKDLLFAELHNEIESRKLSESLNVDEVHLVLEPKTDDVGVMCCYYFVNPRSRTLFWLDDWDGYEIFSDCKGVLSVPHKGLGVQSHYWKHWDLFPVLCNITQELKDEVVSMILHATCDHLTSTKSSCPLNVEELKNYLSLVNRIEPKSAERRGHSAIIIGRIMNKFYHNHFLNFHGEECARLDFDQTVHGWRYHPSLLMTASAPVLFMAPVTNVRALHRVFVDEIVSEEKWNAFVNKLNSQLQDTNLLATVLLNANVGFLAIQSVDNGNGKSLRQLTSYVSLVASMASIILGLVFVGHNRTDTRNTAFQAAKFLHRLQHKRHGLETLAIIYSLPYAFLMWGMVLFFVAFVSEWCRPDDVVSWTSVGSFMFIVALLVAGSIWTSRERTGYWWFEPDPDQVEFDDVEEDNGPSCISDRGFLRRLIPPSWTQNRTGPGSRPESYAVHDITRPQYAVDLSGSIPQEDRAASDAVPITIRQATLLSQTASS
ncbi:hypothetical protein BS17DRAFT_781512 [Gyrodon lividus]|nr:hypothetical protein BS17DRAFT_781512 [Gyrodon lividus]